MSDKRIKVSPKLYKTSRKIGKIASVTNDIETLLSGDIKKICKRIKNKAVNKMFYKMKNNMNKFIF